ncbi:hypothetical protein Scep_026057 [Stephania cephalantha]|uniref:Two-component response regulator-like APRR2 n=1 Tax=Stephania cephalantha TaxID=152367 RepID=A0AAP0HMV2_9MAGN
MYIVLQDFPKGLKVLLVDEDCNTSAHIKSKLEEMDYIVSTFLNANEALLAISNFRENFHVAIVEITSNNDDGSLKFLETAKDFPIIMTSKTNCISLMMKCIALGAAEFLQKPLSKEKLKNIWQHVVHKVKTSEVFSPEQALNAGEGAISKSPKPMKEAIASFFSSIKQKNEIQNSRKEDNFVSINQCNHDQSTVSDRLSAPSNPQSKQGGRLSHDGDCQDQPNYLKEKDCGELEEDAKSVEISNSLAVESSQYGISFAEVSCKADTSLNSTKEVVLKKEDSLEGLKSASNESSHPQEESAVDSNKDIEKIKAVSLLSNSCGNRVNKKKVKVDWTPELHKRFVQAIDRLGIDQAIPSRILELMKVEGLTRHNVASHLQKYRMHKRHIILKEDDRRWQPHPRDPMRRVYPEKPIIAYPTCRPNANVPTSHFYPVWGHPSSHPSFPIWCQPGFPSWQPPDCWLWKPLPVSYVDAWGCPVMPPPQSPCSPFPQVHSSSRFCNYDAVGDAKKGSFNSYPAEEVIDEVLNEAISKPWLPLPLGLKPPSTESVLSELHRLGIYTVPPCNKLQ